MNIVAKVCEISIGAIMKAEYFSVFGGFQTSIQANELI